MSATPLLQVERVSRHFAALGTWSSRGGRPIRAVDDVSFELHRGSTLAVVGESGSGKSTLARLALGLIEPTAGTVRFDGTDIAGLRGVAARRLRQRMQIVFQDPYASLDPRMRIGALLEEPLRVHRLGDRAARQARVRELMRLVQLPEEHLTRFPHQFSGGQRQRIGIARALAVEPELVVCDEPVSALDVSIQAQVINLLKDLQARLGLAYVFISHDLAIVKYVADRVAVMYLGQIVELAPKAALFATPRHPYTRTLLAAIPRPDPHRRTAGIADSGDIPSPANPPPGCRFHTRCAFAIERCRREPPALRMLAPGHVAACHRAEELPPVDALDVSSVSPAAKRRIALADRLRGG